MFDRPTSPVIVLALGFVLAAGVLVSQARRLYFFGDDWSFLLDRNLSWHGLVEPHNEHWSTLPVLAFRTMVAIFGINHYLAYAMMPIILHLLCCVLLFGLMRRHELTAWPSVAATLLFAFLAGNIGENPLWDFQIGFLGSAAFGLIALMLATSEQVGLPRLGLIWLASGLSMMCSGMAIPMLAWLGVYSWMRRDLFRALLATVPPALYYLAWYVAYGRDAPSSVRPTADLIFSFAATGLSTPWGSAIRLAGVGGVVFLGLVAIALLAPLTVRQRSLALSGVVACGISYFLLATSRASLGPDAAAVSRYAYFAMLYTLPAFAAGVELTGALFIDRPIGRRWALGAFALVLIGNGIAQGVSFTNARATMTDGLRPRILATEQLIRDREAFLNGALSPTYQPNITVEALSSPQVRAELPDDAVSRQDLLDAAIVVQVAASPSSFHLPTATGATTHGVTGSLKPGGCSRLKAGASGWLDLPPNPSGSQLAITTYLTALPVQLVDGRTVSTASSVTTTPNAKVFIGSTATDGTLRVTLPAGGYHVCLP